MASCTQKWSRKALGVICLIGVIFIWVVSSEVIQYIFKEEGYNKPFALTYFNTSLFSLYLLGFLFRPSWYPSGTPRCLPWLRWCSSSPSPSPAAANPQPQVLDEQLLHAAEDEEGGQTRPLMLSNARVFFLAVLFVPLWFGANYAFNLSLTLTSVASNTILSTTSSFFTLLMGVVFRVESFSIWKLFGVLASLGGVVLITLIDEMHQRQAPPSHNHNVTTAFISLTSAPATTSPHSNWIGDVVAVVGAVFYAGYAIYLKVKIKDERTLHMPMFFGFVGLICMCSLWILGLVLHYTSAEVFALPSGRTLGFLFLNGIIGTVLSDYLWMLSVLLASPLLSTVGLSLTIPLAIVADLILHGASFSALYVLGAVMIIGGFILVNEDVTRYFGGVFQRCKQTCKRWREP